MALFGFGKKKDELKEEKSSCSCGGACGVEPIKKETETKKSFRTTWYGFCN